MKLYIDDNENHTLKDTSQNDISEIFIPKDNKVNLSDNYFVIKELGREYGLIPMVLFSFLLEQHIKNYNDMKEKNEFFKLDSDSFNKGVCLSDYERRKYEKVLIRIGLIEKVLKEIPCTSFYKIKFSKLNELIEKFNCNEEPKNRLEYFLNKMKEEKKYYSEKEKPIKKNSIRFVYVMQNTRNGYIKIGISKNPKIREKTLQSEEPEIEILFCYKGTISDEKFLHNHFSEKRLRGEWFSLNQDDLTFIEKYLFLAEKYIND